MTNKIYDRFKEFLKENWKFLLIFIITIVISVYRLPFYIDSTGGLLNTSKRVEVENAYEVKGSFNMTYVNEIQATIPLYLISLVNKNWDVVEEEEMTAGLMTMDELIEYGKITMREGAKNAIEIAYKKADKEVTEKNRKTVVLYKTEDSNSDLKVGDEILSVNDTEVTDFDSLDKYIKTKKIGDILKIKVKNNGKEYIRTAKMINSDGEAKIGIILQETRDLDTDPKCTLSYTSAETGASGGLMTTLTIYNYLIKEDITHGKTIAGTGTIEIDGTVGEISGIKYKLAGAVKKHADVFFAPAGDNYEEAIKYKKENNYDIKIVSVKTFDDAVKYLEEEM